MKKIKNKLPKYKYYIAYNADKLILSIGTTSKSSVLLGAKKFIEYRKQTRDDWRSFNTNFKTIECTKSLYDNVTSPLQPKLQWFIYDDKAISIDDLKEISQEHNGKIIRLVKEK
jgi:hypothetical protein